MLQLKGDNHKLTLVDNFTNFKVAEFESEEELRLYKAQDEIYSGKLKAIRAMMLHPVEELFLQAKDRNFYRTLKENKEYDDFMTSLIESDQKTEYCKLINEKYDELLKGKI